MSGRFGFLRAFEGFDIPFRGHPEIAELVSQSVLLAALPKNKTISRREYINLSSRTGLRGQSGNHFPRNSYVFAISKDANSGSILRTYYLTSEGHIHVREGGFDRAITNSKEGSSATIQTYKNMEAIIFIQG